MEKTNISGPTVLITGGEGLIGRAVIDRLADSYNLVSFDRDLDYDHHKKDFIPCDLTDNGSVTQALDVLRQRHGNDIASVIHLAAYYDFSGEPSPLYDELTVKGTQRLLQGLHSFNAEQFLFTSTMLVMKPADEANTITETSPLQAEWDYPQSKIETENLIRREKGGMKAVALRIAGVYDNEGRSIPIGQQISRIYEKQIESVVFPGDADHGQSFVHLEDVSASIEAAVARRRQLDDFEVFLIGEEDVMSYEELQDQIGELLHGEEWPTIRIPRPVAKAGAWAQQKLGQDNFIKPWMIDLADQNYPISARKAREKLGWSPQHRLRDALKYIVGSLEQDPKAWYERHGLDVPKDVLETTGR